MKIQKLQIRNRAGAEGRVTTGSTTELLLDGVRIPGAKSVKIEIDAKSVAKVIIELYAEIEIDSNIQLKKPKLKKGAKQLKLKDKVVALHTLSSYFPAIVGEEI